MREAMLPNAASMSVGDNVYLMAREFRARGTRAERFGGFQHIGAGDCAVGSGCYDGTRINPKLFCKAAHNG